MDDLKGFVPFFFRYLPETRPIQRSCRPNTILCQLMGHPRRRRKQQTHVTIGGAVVASKRERKSSTYSHPTVLNEKELVARLRGCGVFCALLTSVARPAPSDECVTTLAETMSSTHGLKDISI